MKKLLLLTLSMAFLTAMKATDWDMRESLVASLNPEQQENLAKARSMLETERGYLAEIQFQEDIQRAFALSQQEEELQQERAKQGEIEDLQNALFDKFGSGVAQDFGNDIAPFTDIADLQKFHNELTLDGWPLDDSDLKKLKKQRQEVIDHYYSMLTEENDDDGMKDVNWQQVSEALEQEMAEDDDDGMRDVNWGEVSEMLTQQMEEGS